MIVCKKCGSVDNYRTELKSNQMCAYCNDCGTYIKNIPYSQPKLHFGKYAGIYISDITDLQYLNWVVNNLTKINQRTLDAIVKRITELS
jgi:uncharacterized protein (DUF3820 family)